MAICYIFHPLYTGGLFHCYILDEFNCNFRDVGSILSLLFFFFFDGKTILANNADPDQIPYSTPHDVASVQSLHCLLINRLRFPGKSECELGFNVPPTTRSYGDGTSV